MFPFFIIPLLLFSVSGYSQNTLNIQGRITNESGQPVPNVSVVIKGSSTGVASNDAGNFEIMASPNATLVFSSIGYAPQEIPVNNRKNISVIRGNAAGSMTDVVVVGYGTQRKEAVTGSVASISGEKIREIPAPNISQSLQGRLSKRL